MSDTSNEIEPTTAGPGGEDAVEETVLVVESGVVVVDDLSLASDNDVNVADAPEAAALDADSGEVGDENDADSGSAADDAGDSDDDDDAGDSEDEADDADDAGDAGDGAAENPLEVEAEVAADYLEELLDIADLDGDIDTFIEGDRAHVSIVSESKVLVGPDGSVLDALQELTRLAVMTETGDRSRLMLDVAGYRDRRRQQLIEVATAAVGRVRGGDARVALDPMNPFERKIVHDAVAAAGLTSESEGEEPRRHVVVLPAS